MSLNRQLWIAVWVMMLIAWLSGIVVSTHNTKQVFESQLLLKNIDNANALALSLSQLSKDPVTVELMLSAQFDTGHYQRITLADPEGLVIHEKSFTAAQALSVPTWFYRWLEMEVPAGMAQVHDGWTPYGTLVLESQTDYAYQALWDASKWMLWSFSVVALVAGLMGSALLRWITQPLNAVVAHAEAIGGRRFVTSNVPKTLEFGRVVAAMNVLSERIRLMFESEQERLEQVRLQTQIDPLTQSANRGYFLAELQALLQDPDHNRQHGLVLVRVADLQQLNQSLGYSATDALLLEAVATLRKVVSAQARALASATIGRLNGSDFALLLQDCPQLTALTDPLAQAMSDLARAHDLPILKFPMAAMSFSPGADQRDLLTEVGTLLESATDKATSHLALRTATDPTALRTESDWRDAITRAVIDGRVQSVFYPVHSDTGALLHRESMMQLMIDGEPYSAGSFMPWARRLDLLADLDVAHCRNLLSQLPSFKGDLAINLSIDTLKDPISMNQLVALLESQRSEVSRIWFEINEQGAYQALDALYAFCHRLKPFGCRLGLQQAGVDLARMKNLQEIGLDFIKVDAALIQALHQDAQQDYFLRGLVSLAHSIGLMVIAEGVRDEQAQLKMLGFEGWTGPGVTEI